MRVVQTHAGSIGQLCCLIERAGDRRSERPTMINEIGMAEQRMLKEKRKQNKPKGNTSGLKCYEAGEPKAL
jgi:hypothetical protein